MLNPDVLTIFVLLLCRLLHWQHRAVFGDTRLAVASYCKIWNRFPNNYGKQNCEWFVSAKLIISISCIYCVLIPGLSELPYLLLEIINHFIIVFIFSSFSFSSKPEEKNKQNQFPLKMYHPYPNPIEVNMDFATSFMDSRLVLTYATFWSSQRAWWFCKEQRSWKWNSNIHL